MQFFVYILRCANGAYYVGSHRGNDVMSRVHAHNQGLDPKAYTFNRRPVELVWCEDFEDPSDMVRAERRLKGWSRAKKEAYIRGDLTTLKSLAKSRTAPPDPAKGKFQNLTGTKRPRSSSAKSKDSETDLTFHTPHHTKGMVFFLNQWQGRAMSEQKLPFEIIRARRAGARLAAVQALYQMEQTGQSGKAAIRDLMDDRLGLGPDEDPVEEADPDLFKSIVNATIEHQTVVDKAILARLSKGWKLSRLDSTTRSILRAAAAELVAHQELSRRILLDEYVSLAHDFFDTTEANFVNAVLDNVSKDLRPEEA